MVRLMVLTPPPLRNSIQININIELTLKITKNIILIGKKCEILDKKYIFKNIIQ